MIYTFRFSTSSKCTSLIEHQSNIPHTYSLIRSIVVRLGRLRQGFGRLQTFSPNKKRNCFLSRYVYLLFLRYKCHSIIALSASFIFLKREILQLPESIIPRFFVRPRNRFLWRVFLWKNSPLGKTSFRTRTRTRTRWGTRWSWTAWAWSVPLLLLDTVLVLVQRSTNDLQNGFQLVGSVL